MNLKNIYFSWLIYWGKMKGLLNGIAEAIILLASLASFFVLIYQFGFVQTPDSVHILERSRPFILLAFFTGITLRYVVRFQEIIQEKMLYLDISIYFLLFAVLSSKIFFKDAIAHSLPYLSFLTKPLFVYVLLLLLSTIHLSRQTFTLMQTRIKPSLLFLLSFVFVILVGAGLLSLPNATTHRIPFIDALFISTTSVCVTGLTTVDVATSFTHIGHIIIMILIQIGGIGVMTFTSFFALSFMGKSSFTSKMMLKDMLNEDRTGGLFRVILNILFVTLFIEGIGAYFIYMDVRGSLPGGTQQELFYAMFHAVSAFCNAGISTLSGNMYDPLVADKYNLHFWIAMLIIFGGLGFPIVFNYLKLLHHLLMNGIKILIGKQKHYIHTPRIINVHTYIVVISTLILLITGTAFYLFFEYDNTLGDLPLRGKLANAFLGAVTPRTAGFNVADMATLAPPTLMLTLILMVIGAAPMSTGGGLKVTTVFVALVTTLNAAREKDKVEVRKREIAPFAIRRAFAIIMMYFMWVAIATWVLSYTEKGAPLFSLLFEVVSALSTVGLSIDYTPHLRGKLANAFLGAVTPRTAGFNVADMATLAPPTLMLTLILMVIGAAPMSTGGGLKVTTVFVALVTTLNAAREKDKVEVRKREIAPFAIRRAFAIIMMYFMWVAIATWVLSYTEKGAPLFSLLFEVVSALSTVGLSIDYTPHLTPIGKIIIISTMLVGRIGVLAFLVSFCKEYTKKDYTYPQENILM